VPVADFMQAELESKNPVPEISSGMQPPRCRTG